MPRKIRQPQTSRDAFRRVRSFDATMARRLQSEINAAQNDGKAGLSCWELERATGWKHESVSGCLRGMEDRGQVAVVPGIYTRVPESGNRAQVYALGGTPPTGPRQAAMLD